MSPVSPVFLTVVRVRIGIKTRLEWEHPFIVCVWSQYDGGNIDKEQLAEVPSKT